LRLALFENLMPDCIGLLDLGIESFEIELFHLFSEVKLRGAQAVIQASELYDAESDIVQIRVRNAALTHH
jgi:hypothetical protein